MNVFLPRLRYLSVYLTTGETKSKIKQIYVRTHAQSQNKNSIA